MVIIIDGLAYKEQNKAKPEYTRRHFSDSGRKESNKKQVAYITCGDSDIIQQLGYTGILMDAHHFLYM